LVDPHNSQTANSKVGKYQSNLLAKVEALPLERIKSLGEELLDFTAIADLEQWLASID
jgi:hypothetical protein